MIQQITMDWVGTDSGNLCRPLCLHEGQNHAEARTLNYTDSNDLSIEWYCCVSLLPVSLLLN